MLIIDDNTRLAGADLTSLVIEPGNEPHAEIYLKNPQLRSAKINTAFHFYADRNQQCVLM